MSEKELMKKVAEFHMPDILEVKKTCLDELNAEKEKRCKVSYLPKLAVIVGIIVCICVLPKDSLAKNIVEKIQTILHLNDDTVALGEMGECDIEIPDDCEEVISDGVTYLTKSYNNVSDLVKDIRTDIYAWVGTDRFLDNGVMLNIVKDDYGRIALVYDVTGKTVIDKDNDTVDLQSVDLFVYFPLSKETSISDVMILQNEQLKYSTIDDEGNIEKYQQNTEYELVEQYKSRALGTDVTVISSKLDTDGSGTLGEISESDTVYYLYFTLDGMCYQVNCVGTLERAHDVIENIKKI